MTIQSQDLEHGGKPPERPPQAGTREPKRKERDKGSGAPPKDKGEGTYSGDNTPSRPD